MVMFELTGVNRFVVARYQIFTLTNGAFVVQWQDNTVQELLTGQYRAFDPFTDYGYPVSDYELSQLRETGYIEQFDHSHVWLQVMPPIENNLLDTTSTRRAYYLSTGLEAFFLQHVMEILYATSWIERLVARVRNGFVIILDKDGLPFQTFEDAESIQRRLYYDVPETFSELSVGFVESRSDRHGTPLYVDPNGINIDIGELMASQEDITATENKVVVLAVRNADERRAIQGLLEEMKMMVYHAESGREAILLLEDLSCDFLVADIQLSDMHTWKMLGTLKESVDVSSFPIVVIMNEQTVVPMENITSVVRPVAMARLRHIIWSLFKDQPNLDEKKT